MSQTQWLYCFEFEFKYFFKRKLIASICNIKIVNWPIIIKLRQHLTIVIIVVGVYALVLQVNVQVHVTLNEFFYTFQRKVQIKSTLSHTKPKQCEFNLNTKIYKKKLLQN